MYDFAMYRNILRRNPTLQKVKYGSEQLTKITIAWELLEQHVTKSHMAKQLGIHEKQCMGGLRELSNKD
jgi:hypothetical protein